MALDRGQPGGASFAGCFTRKEESWSKRGVGKFTSPSAGGGKGTVHLERRERGWVVGGR